MDKELAQDILNSLTDAQLEAVITVASASIDSFRSFIFGIQSARRFNKELHAYPPATP